MAPRRIACARAVAQASKRPWSATRIGCLFCAETNAGMAALMAMAMSPTTIMISMSVKARRVASDDRAPGNLIPMSPGPGHL